MAAGGRGTKWYSGVIRQVGEHRSSTASEPVFMYDVRFDAEDGESADEEEGIPQLYVRAAPVEVSAADREERHDTLVDMGFDSTLVMQALDRTGWDVAEAANMLAEQAAA